MTVELTLLPAASLALGVVALLRLGALPDHRLRHGAWSKVAWSLLVVLGGMGSLLPIGAAIVVWRTGRHPNPATSGQVPPITLADGAPAAAADDEAAR